MPYAFFKAVVQTERARVHLPLRTAKEEAELDAKAFCNGRRSFSVVGLVGDEARQQYLAELAERRAIFA